MGLKEMKFITNYKELGGNTSLSLFDHLEEKPIEWKEIILYYLKNGKYDGIRCATIYDLIKNEPTFESIYAFTDDEYYWDSEEIYYFENYNLRLNEEFILKVKRAHTCFE